MKLIIKQAKLFDVSPDEYVLSLIPKPEQYLALRSDIPNAEFEADMNAFTEGTENDSSYNGTYSRKDIYSDHD